MGPCLSHSTYDGECWACESRPCIAGPGTRCLQLKLGINCPVHDISSDSIYSDSSRESDPYDLCTCDSSDGCDNSDGSGGSDGHAPTF